MPLDRHKSLEFNKTNGKQIESQMKDIGILMRRGQQCLMMDEQCLVKDVLRRMDSVSRRMNSVFTMNSIFIKKLLND